MEGGASDVRIVRRAPGRYVVEVRGEDHTLGNLIVKTIMSKGLARFAYYEVPHPLEDLLIIYIDCEEDEDPREILAKAVEHIVEENEAFRKGFLEALKAAGASAGFEEGG